MTFLENYLDQFESNGHHEQAVSIRKTATDVGNKYLRDFDYNSNKIGLLFGNIQSGKTGQMFGIASEAADRSFPYFLLLETDSTLLQQQTYERAERDLPDFVVCDEDEEQKFRNHGTSPVMVVVKKNSRVLKSWADRFKNTRMLDGNPLFILDDEADAGSLNTKVNQRIKKDKKYEKKQSTINRYLDEIRQTASSSIYLQVTGTPQAVLLQTIESEFQPTFTYYFSPGKGYLGGDFFFPADKTPEFVRFTDGKKPQEVAVSATLRHLVVSAQVMLSGKKVSNCIIHPGIKQFDHESARLDIEEALNWLVYHHGEQVFVDAVKKEYDNMHPQNTTKQSYNDILNRVLHMLEKREYSIVMLNGTSNDGSDDYAEGCNFIIGGTNLGRGVTFGQLNTFIYTRTSKSPQADTMWQHSRMFGYDRDGGLITMYSTKELYKLFSEINETNNSIIAQAKQGQKIKIAYPDGLMPTRSNVLDKSILNILVGGSNHFPLNPINKSYEDISDMVSRFTDLDDAKEVTLQLLVEILNHINTEESFNMKGYVDMIKGELAKNPLAQGRLLVRRNRDIMHASRALLSPKDWATTNSFKNEFVLTLYSVVGSVEKGWDGKSVWVPNIKLPESRNFYII